MLEAVDFAADVFALQVATRIALRRLGPASTPAAIRDEAAIDLADRRLRRYLTWHLLRMRAETIETRSTSTCCSPRR